LTIIGAMEYKPIKFGKINDLKEFGEKNALVKIDLLDLLDTQIKDLIKVKYPSHTDAQLTDELVRWENTISADYGSIFYYPWQNKAVKILEEDDFICLRTSRNKYKITADEQSTLMQKHIVVLGMSVGKAVAQICALERICGKITLVDFDDLDSSNLNRIMTPLFNVGLPKAVITAREISEIDPYLEIAIELKGITSENMTQVIGNNMQTNLVIEVCNSLEMKVKTRMHCLKEKIPVIMDTSDRGMIDVERYDKNISQIFHGLLKNINFKGFDFNNKEKKMELLISIIDLEKVSERGKQSLFEIGKTLRTWPQLASDVFIGAAATASVARRILLEHNVNSKRYYFDLEKTLNS